MIFPGDFVSRHVPPGSASPVDFELENLDRAGGHFSFLQVFCSVRTCIWTLDGRFGSRRGAVATTTTQDPPSLHTHHSLQPISPSNPSLPPLPPSYPSLSTTHNHTPARHVAFLARGFDGPASFQSSLANMCTGVTGVGSECCMTSRSGTVINPSSDQSIAAPAQYCATPVSALFVVSESRVDRQMLSSQGGLF